MADLVGSERIIVETDLKLLQSKLNRLQRRYSAGELRLEKTILIEKKKFDELMIRWRKLDLKP